MKKLYYFLLLCAPFSTNFGQSETIVQSSDDEAVVYDNRYFQKLIDSSNTYYFEGNHSKSLEINIELLGRAFEVEDPYYIHYGYRHMAYDYMALEDTLLARENFEKSERYAKLSKNDTAIALTYMDLANFYSGAKEDHKTALDYHDRSITLFKKIKDSAGLAKAHYNTVMTAMQAEDYNKVLIHIIRAKKLNKFEEHSSFSIGLDNMMGEYYLRRGNYELAERYLIKALDAAQAIDLSSELEYAWLNLSETYYEQKKFQEAYDARLKYKEYADKNESNLASSVAQALSAKFQVSEYRKDVRAAELRAKLQAELVQNKSKLNNFLIVAFVFFLIIFVALFLAYRNRKQLIKELKVKNKEYLAAKEQSEKLSKAKSNFFSTVSHELRTPLYGVIGLSTILLEDESLKKHEKDLKSLKFSADYLLALINDVLQINKIDSKTLEDEHNSFNPRELIETIVASFEYMKIQNRNNIHIEVADNVPPLIRGNSVRLSQILMNLISNACKFTEDGDIWIMAKTWNLNAAKASITFTVKDTGMGIAQEKHEAIFDEFAQIDSTNYNYQGSGLGLPIVKKLLSLSNSTIEVESELGKGSSFSFTLVYDVLQQVEDQKEPDLLDTKLLKGKRILIVEDNRINQIVTQKVLEKNDILCRIAENGLEAVKMVKKYKFDLILMDVNMPVMNGMEASREIRKTHPDIPIIALTAVEIEEMRYKIFKSGMNDIIVKPYDVTKFTQTILRNIISKNVALGRSHLQAI